MISHVLLVGRAKNKVACGVVCAVVILVVNLFALCKWPAYNGFHYYDVLENVSLYISPRMSRDQQFSVSLLENKWLLSRVSRTSYGAVS